jgi:hypothetical protein
MDLTHVETTPALRSLLRRHAILEGGGDGECCVCGIARDDWPRFRLRKCGHCAHTRCLKKWWHGVHEERARWVPLCPMCRSGDLPALEQEPAEDDGDVLFDETVTDWGVLSETLLNVMRGCLGGPDEPVLVIRVERVS